MYCRFSIYATGYKTMRGKCDGWCVPVISHLTPVITHHPLRGKPYAEQVTVPPSATISTIDAIYGEKGL